MYPTLHTTEQDVLDASLFLTHCAETRPKAQIQDFVKRIYQSEFGGGHMIQNEADSLERLRREIAGLTDKQKRQPYIDAFFGDYCRMNLSVSQLLSPELMNRIFVLSAENVPKGAWFRFEEKLKLLYELCDQRPELFRFTPEQAKEYLIEYKKAGYPAVHHSAEYRKAYEPAYRVVRKEYVRFPELYAAMEQCLREKGSVRVAIDGNSGSGKSTAAKLIASLFDANLFHADDFFLPLEKRTPERLEEVGGNFDRERFREELCEKVKEEKPFSFRPFDCGLMQLGDPVEVSPKKVSIFEGCYCMHPELREYYDVKVFLSVPPGEQQARILKRSGSMMLRRFLDEWIPKENRYFQEMNVREACSLVYEQN